MMSLQLKTQRFHLIELLVVIAIIGILSSVVLASLQPHAKVTTQSVFHRSDPARTRTLLDATVLSINPFISSRRKYCND